MKSFRRATLIIGFFLFATRVEAQPSVGPSRVVIAPSHVLSINGKQTFTIGFTLPPAPDAKAPNGKFALEEFREAGAVFIRTGPMWGFRGQEEPQWDDAWIEREREYMDAAARAGMFCVPWLKELAAVEVGDVEKERRLRRVVRLFKDHPALGVWKGEDEPQWGAKPVGPLVRAREIITQEDPHHPLWIVQAPRGTVEELQPYNAAYDIGGVDVYPIGYPPGKHLLAADTNREISMVGDYTRKMLQVVDGRQPIWFTLQIAWSGVLGPKTLRFPTFPEQRFMTYQAIINGTRGLMYFGGSMDETLSERDRPFGWNWTYWQRVLRPVLEEVGSRSPLAEALCAPESELPVKASGSDIELCVREVGREVFVLACCRDPRKTSEVTFRGLPRELGEGDVLYESPRKVTATQGALRDWFAPFEVHVYRFVRPASN
jgi:hypothetical protein